MKSFIQRLLFVYAILIIISTNNIKAQDNMEVKSIKSEFYNNDKKETLYKGKYIGQIKKEDKIYFHFQFDGALKGNMRFLNIYFETNKDKEVDKSVYCIETNRASEGSTAYLLLKLFGEDSFDLSYKLKNNQYDKNYDFSKLPQSPNAFFEKAYAESEIIQDTVYIVSLVGNQYSNWFTVELLLWYKDKEGKYRPERYKTSVNGDSEFFEIKYTHKIN